MCGIAGIIGAESSPREREERVARMCAAMLHRGPDDSGIESSAEATLGMRRLAIFDPANGHQPMRTDDGRYTIVFNGAVYNHAGLREELEAEGYIFRTRCDTEVLLAALANWGEAALPRLRGMFAFAFWDAKERTLFAARDPFGIKPLYYALKRTSLVFASEVGAMVAGGVDTGGIDPRSVSDCLAWLAVPAPRTIYRDIRSLGPGEAMKFKAGVLSVSEWWNFRSIPARPPECSSREEFVRALRVHLEDTIGAHVLADVPVGAFLSGGLDSAVVAGLMARASGNALRTFSIGFEEDGYSEADLAESSARHLGAVHHTRVLTGDEVARDLDQILAAQDQPSADGINTYYASQTAQQAGMKVALSGLGGDELFGGYPSFSAIPSVARVLASWKAVPGVLKGPIINALGSLGTRPRKLAEFLRDARDLHEIASLQRKVIPKVRRLALLSSEARAAVAGDEFHPALHAIRSDVQTDDAFAIASAWELRTYMADVLLRDSDVMSMRNSLELRVPFIDRPLIEWLWREPSGFKMDAKQPKSVLFEAVRDVVPPGLMRRRKRGFTLPFARWMRADLKPFLDSTFEPQSAAQSGLFDPAEVGRFWKGFLAGGHDREWSRVLSVAVIIAFVNRKRSA